MPSVIQAGTASNTALTLTSDTSGELQFKTNNGATTVMTLDTLGDVGIGTTSPVAPLDIISGTARMYFSNQSSTAFITAVNTANSAYAPMAINGSEMILKTGDAERMRINSSGQVGIGTSSPSTWSGSNLVSFFAGGNNFAGITAINSNTGTGIGGIQFGSDSTYVKAAIGLLRDNPNGAGSLVFYNDSNNDAANWSTGDEKMRLTSSGNLGIGTNSPSARLHVSGGQIIVNTTDNTSNIYLQNSGTTYLQLRGNTTSAFLNNPSAGPMVFGTSDTERMRITSTGYVGIGTTGPGGLLHVRQGASGGSSYYSNQLLVENNGVAAQGFFTPTASYAILSHGTPLDGDSASILFDGNSRYMAFRTVNGTERMRIPNYGGLCVGVTGNYSNGTITGFNIVGSGGTTFRSDSSLAAGTGWGHFYGTSGTNTVANISIYGNGTIQNSTGSYGAYSDIKLKENIVDATPKLDDLLKVRIVNYNLKSDESKQKQIGVIAQELETIFPGLIDNVVDRDSNGKELDTVTKGVKYSVFIPMLIKAIQELKAELDEAKAEIQALKGAQ